MRILQKLCTYSEYAEKTKFSTVHRMIGCRVIHIRFEMETGISQVTHESGQILSRVLRMTKWQKETDERD